MANRFRDILTATDTAEAEQEQKTGSKTPGTRAGFRKKGVLAKGLSSVFSGSFLTSEKNIKHLPYILFLALIAILYIANGYYADDKIRESNKISNQLKELRSEYISTKSELMFASKQSEIAKSAEKIGLKEPLVPPTKIEVDSLELYKESN